MAATERHLAESTRSGVAPGALSRLMEELVAVAGESSSAPEVPLPPGERLGRFEITRQIGRGGFGVVYEARDPELGRSVALKTLRPRAARGAEPADALARLRREAEAVARLDHPSIVTLFDVGSWPGGGFLVMELLRGETLSRRLSRGAPGLDQALGISEDVARALAHAHERGVLHRDLKPANVFLTDDGRVKLLDFGIAHLLGRADESGGSGTPEYMAPEQLDEGRCDARADVYAAALMLAEMLAGTRLDPGLGDVAVELTGRGCPRKVAEIVAAALSADPDARPRDGAAWLASLHALRRAVERRQRLRRGVRLAAAALVLALVAGIASWSVWPSRDRSGPLTVVVGDVANETGDPELGAVSELIATSLRQSHRLRVLTRDAVGEHLRALARGPADRIDEALARGLGERASARAVLLGSLRKVGEAYALEVRGVDPGREQYAFTVTEQGRGREVIFELVDRTALAVRRALEEPDADVRAADEKIGELVTRSLAAYQEYAEGLSCRQRGADGCRRHLERAVEIDPTFAMAQYELAVSAFWGPDFAGQGLSAIRQAVLHVNRAPERERIKIRAFAAWAEGREQDADQLYREAAARHPDDFFVMKMAAGFLLTRDEPDRALPLQRRAVELAPLPGLGMLELADTLSALGRTDELAALESSAASVVASGGPPEAALALAVARRSRGDTAGAVEAARMAVAAAPSARAREEAQMDVWIARIEAGDLGVEPELRAQCHHEASYQLLTLLGLSGRRAEAFRVFEDGDRPECPPRTAAEWRELGNALFHQAALTRFAAGFGDVERARRHARRAVQRNPALGPHLAVYLAYAGDAETAAELARGLDPGSPRQRGYEAVALWRRGERERARELLRELASRTAWSSTPHVLPPSFLYGELAAELGDDAAAIEALERFGALHFYRLDFWSWAYPRSLYLLARAYDRTGDAARARDRVEQLLTLWRSSDPDQPLLAEARALGARLGVVVDGT